jgi:hypothetical protein
MSDSCEERRKRLLLMLGRIERVVAEKGLLEPADRDPSLDAIAHRVRKDEYMAIKSLGISSGDPLPLTYSGVDWNRVKEDISMSLFDVSFAPSMHLLLSLTIYRNRDLHFRL